MADRAIAELNGKRLPGHGRKPGRSRLANGELHSYHDTLQVRYADTDIQKQIKTTETELEKMHALELSGELPPRSRKGQAYRRLSFSTEQKIRNSGKKWRRGSGCNAGLGISMGSRSGALPTPPSSFRLSLPPAPMRFPAFPSSSVGASHRLSFPSRSLTPGLDRTTSQPYAPPNSPVNEIFTQLHYASDTPPSLGGFTSSTYSGSPTSLSSLSPQAFLSFTSGTNGSNVQYSGLPPRREPGAFQSGAGANVGLGLSFGSEFLYGSSMASPPYGRDVSQGMLALQAQQDRISRSLQNIDRMTGRRPSEGFTNSSFEGMNNMFSNTTLNNRYENDGINEARATYDLAKLGFAPPSTPPPESSHPFFDSSTTAINRNRPSSRNHQRAHTTAALTAFPATPSSHDPNYSPSKLLAPASALARRSSAVEARVARRKGSQISLNSSFDNSPF